MTIVDFNPKARTALSPTRGLGGFTFFWTMTAFTVVCAIVALIALLGPSLGL